METLIENLGNTTPSLSLIVSLIVGSGIFAASYYCKNTVNSISQNDECDRLKYLGGAMAAIGIVLFWFAQGSNLAFYEGSWIIVSVITAAYVAYRLKQ